MPRPCGVCVHPERKEIDAALLGAEEDTVIARRIGISHDAVNRHRKHILRGGPVLPDAAAILRRAESLGQLGVVELAMYLLAFCVEVMERASTTQRPALALQAVRASTPLLNAIVTARGTAAPFQSVADLEHRAAQMHQRVLNALKPFPEVHGQVARMLTDRSDEPAA